MNDFANDKETAILKNFARGIGEIYGALDSVAKSKLFCQAHSDVADRDNPAIASHPINDIAAIMRFHLFLHRRHYVGRAQVNFFPGSRAAGYQICAHKNLFAAGWPHGRATPREADRSVSEMLLN